VKQYTNMKADRDKFKKWLQNNHEKKRAFD